MNLSKTLLSHFFCAFLLIILFASCAKQEQPNIVWIFTDDHSYQTIGAYGGHLQELNPTPNLDKSSYLLAGKCFNQQIKEL